MADTTTYERLSERFPAEEHKKRKQGSADLTYITGEMVISRLNKVLGVAGWSFGVLREGTTEIEAWVLGELTATIDGTLVVRQHYGNQDLARGARATGDLFKSAATDALKKAATTIGVGLYLYDEDERREVEAEMREASRPKPPQQQTQAPTPINDKARDAAMVTGANPAAKAPNAFICADDTCHAVVTNTVTILKKKDGPRVTVSVAEFSPKCEERLGALYCGEHYDKRQYGAA